MCSIYLINVGANASHKSKARTPIFNDLSFVYVSIPDQDGTPYPLQMHRFVRHPENLCTHNDPDWDNLTYGDDCSNPRGRALINVTRGDILLFWGLLWQNNGQNNGNNWHGRGFTGERGWYLLGALRVKDFVEGGHNINSLNLDHQDLVRVQQNAHCSDGDIPQGDRVFLGEKDKKHSRLFDKAVELWVPKTEQKSESKWKDSLLYKTCRAANGRCLSLNSRPRWYRSLRACRKMWDLNDAEQRERAEIVRKAIQQVNKDFDLLRDV